MKETSQKQRSVKRTMTTSLNRKWLPTIAGVAGAALGAIGMTV